MPRRAWRDQHAGILLHRLWPRRTQDQVDHHVAHHHQRQRRRDVGEGHPVAIRLVEIGKDRQQCALRRVEARIGVQRAVVAQEARIGRIGLGKFGAFGGHEIVQRPLVQLRGVIAVIVVLEHHLPVPGEDARFAGTLALGTGKVVMRDRLGDCGQAGGERGCVEVEIDEQEALPDLDLEAGQAVLFLLEVARLLHRRRAGQLAVEAVGPVMIGAQEHPRVARAFGHQHRPVRAHRGHRVDLTIAAAGDDDRLADNLSREIVADIGHPALAPDAQPLVVVQRFLLELVEVLVGVAFGGKRLGLGQVDRRGFERRDESGGGQSCRHGDQHPVF